MRMRHLLTVAVFLAAAALSSASASAGDLPIDFGLRTGYYVGTDGPFLGAEVVLPVLAHIKANPNVEWALGDDQDTITLNADAYVELPVPETSITRIWAGAGPAILFRDYSRPSGPAGRPPHHKDDDVDLGLNLFSGIGWQPDDRVGFYLQGKLVLTSDIEGVFGFGIRF